MFRSKNISNNMPQHFCEWKAGIVVKCPPIDGRHDELNRYMAMLMEAYLPLRPIGRIREAPFVMRLPAIARSREPDLQIILNTNPHALTQTYMDGPADICIEVVSPESVQRDHGAKFEEYEKGGVPEYWILDPIHRETRFYRLDEDGVYVAYSPDEHGYYETPQLPGLRLHVPTLWTSPLPGPSQIVTLVQQMLNS
jgi:Uma2 family endonuclease